jgi:hypothetical protein
MSHLKNHSDMWSDWEVLTYRFVLNFKGQLLHNGYVNTTAL